MDKLFIPILVGTTRPHRLSIRPATFVEEVGKTFPEIEVQLIDPLDFNFPNDGNDPEGKDPRYTEITARADGFFIVTPEYNSSFPGSLKRMLDSELKNYSHKPVAFAGVSNGQWGGIRAIEALVHTVRKMGMVTSNVDVQFPNVQDIFNEDGVLLDEAYRKRVRRVYAELIWMAKTLKYGRDTIVKEKIA